MYSKTKTYISLPSPYLKLFNSAIDENITDISDTDSSELDDIINDPEEMSTQER